MRRAENLFEFARGVVRLVAIAADVASQRVLTARPGSADVIGRMSDRQLQDVGLSRTRMPAVRDDFASAQAQLGMVR